MKHVKRGLLVVALLLVGGGAWVGWQLNRHASLTPYAGLAMPVANGPGLRVTFLGVATLLFDDGDTAIMTDGFFTRPDMRGVLFKPLVTDREAVAHALERTGVQRLAAVVVVHTHYDHAMDAPEVAQRTGAVVVGSNSTANVARGSGIPENRIRVPQPGEPMQFGKFKVTLIRSRHVSHGMPTGEITAPVQLPLRASDYLEGGSYSVLIEHEGKSMLVQGSAGYVEGALKGRHADVVFLGTGLLGSQEEAHRQAYWKEVVQAVGARRVIPIHWDDFTRPLTEPIQTLPELFDDFGVSMDFLLRRGKADAVDVRMAPVWGRIDPFAGL